MDQKQKMTNSKTTTCTSLTILKAALVICIILVASRNFSLHNLAARNVMEQRVKFENERKKSFVVGSSANDAAVQRHELEAPTKLRSGMESQKTNYSVKLLEPATVPSDLSQLPLALQPVNVSSEECCPMLNRPPKKPKCGEICLTPHACNNTLYPYNSLAEKEFLKPMLDENKIGLRSQCNEMNSRMHPPYQWCQQWLEDSKMHLTQKTYNATQTRYEIDPYAAKLPPAGCSIFNNGGGSGSYQHLMLFPEAKMAFCGIPKGELIYR